MTGPGAVDGQLRCVQCIDMASMTAVLGGVAVVACAHLQMTGAEGLRDDPTRTGTTLVRVNHTLYEFAAATGGFLAGHFDRDDFESIAPDHVVLWASGEQLRVMHDVGVRSVPHPDIGAISFAEEKARGYMDTAGEEPEWDQYCGYECMTERLRLLEQECHFPFELSSIGESVQGRNLWAVKVGDTGPEVLLGGNIHGDEPVGNQAIQRWLWETCNNPSDEQVEAALGAQAWFVPNLNPDGYEANRRGNANNVDLNRNFPQPTGAPGTPATPDAEAAAWMAFVLAHDFSVSTHFHGGAVVCNTAYDNCYTAEIVPRPCPPALPSFHPRADDVLPSSRSYCDAMMAAGVSCGSQWPDCQTNGASWYQISGSQQDWEFHFANVAMMTMEMTQVKRPPGSTLPGHYEGNKQAFHDFIVWPAGAKSQNASLV